ncbi:protein ALP1-like isoform X2 [Miscanthus floridulus]|uniref:protein ALP1-like isoform X2 n=1 Tax=Miscanthus floridulus TaxID=154761 RepID=UPI00345B2E6E
MDLEEKRRILFARAAALITAMYALLFARLRMLQSQRPQINYGPMSIRDEERQRNLNLIYNYNDIECVNMLRMRRAPFFSLCNLLREKKLLADNINSCVEEQVAMFLHIVGHNQRFRVVKQNWRRSIETVHRHFKDVLYAIGELRQEMIRPPSNETPVKISNSHRWYPYFKDCIGAIDGTHVFAKVPAKMQAAFRGRKNAPTQNVLAAVSFDLKFTYVLAGWEGSAHDATILADALQREDGLRVPPGKFFLVDAGYACRPGFLPPYRGCRYHLKEYGNRNYPTNPKELYNLRHSSLRVTVERAFGALKNRFRIIDTNKPFHRLRTQIKLVLACCIMHNWILSFGVDEVIPEEFSWVPNDTNSQPHPAHMDDNAAWALQRDEWANHMWANRGLSRI